MRSLKTSRPTGASRAGSPRRLRGSVSPGSNRQLPSVTHFPPSSSAASLRVPAGGTGSPLWKATTSELGRAKTTWASMRRSGAVRRHGMNPDLSDPFTLDPRDPDPLVAGMENLQRREAELLPAQLLVVVDHYAAAAALRLLQQPNHRRDGGGVEVLERAEVERERPLQLRSPVQRTGEDRDEKLGRVARRASSAPGDGNPRRLLGDEERERMARERLGPHQA